MSLYVTADDLKTILRIGAGTYADEALEAATTSASDSIDAYCGTECGFTATASQSRYYDGGGVEELAVDFVRGNATIAVDRDQDGTYEEAWTAGVDYVWAPVNASLDGKPYTKALWLRGGNFKTFPPGPKAVKVTGTHGWEEVPSQVTQAAILLANRFLTRTKSAPLGILVAQAADQVRVARLGNIDPDAAFLLGELGVGRNTGFRSVQLS